MSHASDAACKLAAIAHEAGRIVMKHYDSGVQARRKTDESPVTAADEEAEALILQRLAEVFPGVPIIAEEEAAAGRIQNIGDRFFLVDPLDGTKEFINHNGEFTVNIAEIVGGVPVRGVVYAPALSRLFFGETPGGAYEVKVSTNQTFDGKAATPIAVRTIPPEGMTAVASRSHRDAKTEEYLAAYSVKDFVSAGSSLKFCLVAAGEADIYPRTGRTMEWDTGAGHAVLRAAGGSVTQLDGSPFVYGKGPVFENPFFVAKGKV